MAITPIDIPDTAPVTDAGHAVWLGLAALQRRPTDTILVVTADQFEHAERLIDGMCVVSWDGEPATLDASPFHKRNVVLWPPWPREGALQLLLPVAKALYTFTAKAMVVKPADDAPDRRSPADFGPGEGAQATAWAKTRLVEYRTPPPGAATTASNVRHFRRTKLVTERDLELRGQQAGLELEPLPPEYSDDALALAFTEAYADTMRYVAKWSSWMHWTGNRWAKDETRLAWDMTRIVGRDASNRAATDPAISLPIQKRIAQRCTDVRTVYAIERMANADRRHAATTDQFDADDWILNTPTGVVDLTTGQLRPHRQDDYCTLITNASPTVGATCPRWLAFLDRVTTGDADLIAFLARIAGYCMTGSIREHALAFLWGTGRNGKGTFLNTLGWVLGDYGKVAGMETLTERKQAAHSQELAVLMGARMVTAQETEEGRHWAEARIKALTGGDPITAHFMRQNNFTFLPTFKLLIAGNHKPALRSVDPAMRSRMNLIPFTVEIPPAERDGGLADKLRAEGDGIMRWMLDGCMQWQRIGLRPPECVRAATDEYLQSEDAIARWMTDCLDVAPSNRNRRGDLYRNYVAWCEASGERQLPMKRWHEGIMLKGVADIGKRNGVEWMQGARIRVADEQPGRYAD